MSQIYLGEGEETLDVTPLEQTATIMNGGFNIIVKVLQCTNASPTEQDRPTRDQNR